MRRSSKVPKYTHWGVTISIYSSKSRYSAQFIINGHDRYRIEKASEYQALQAAKRRVEEVLGQDPTLPLEERCANEILAKHGISLLEAARLIDHQTKLLEPTGTSIADAVTFFLKQNVGTETSVATVVKELLLKKERDSGVHHTADLRSRLRNRFSLDFGIRAISSITGPEIAKWLDELPGSNRTRRNYHSSLVLLFKFAKERGYLPENLLTAPEKVRKPKSGRVVRRIFTPDELQKLLEAATQIKSPALVPLVIQCFTGIRSEEIRQSDPQKDRLRWSDIQLDQDEPEIHIREEVSKTGEERYVFIPPCLGSWLRAFQKPGDDPVYAGKYLWKDYYAIGKRAGVPWKKNGPRKSFNTYHAALSGSLADTAGEAGNSEQMIRRYYRKQVSQAHRTAKEWFSLGMEKFSIPSDLLKRAA